MMDCEYILQYDLHEKFLKGLMSENEIVEYQAHLEKCESCQKSYENEQMLFEGIRFAGRQAMKLEISNQVDKLRGKTGIPDWTLFFKVAAVLFFLVIMPGTLYYLNTDLFDKKAEMVQFDEADHTSSIEIEEAESVEEQVVFDDLKEPEPVKEISRRREVKKEKSVAPNRGNGISAEHEISRISAQKADNESLDDILGAVEGIQDKDGVGGKGVLESVSGQKAANLSTDGLTETGTGAIGKKTPVGKLSRQAPAISSKRPQPVTAKQARQKDALYFEEKQSDESEAVIVYKLLPSEPILMQRNYSKGLKSESIKSNRLQTLNFSSGYKQILANITPPEGYGKDTNEINQSFKVILNSRRPDLIDMNWYPLFDIKFYHPEKISITQPNDSNLLIKFDEKLIYKVDISKDTTEAILQK